MPVSTQGTWQRLRATLFGCWAWLLLALLAPFAWLGIVLLPTVDARWQVVRGAARLLLWATGTRVVVNGLEHLADPGPSKVIVCNHASYADVVVLVAVLPYPVSFVAKKELADPFWSGFALRRIDTFFVDRADRRHGLADYRRITKGARRARTLLYFPEGTFGSEPGLLPFRMGAFATAVTVNAPVVPVVLQGTRRLLPSRSRWPQPATITVTVLPPIDVPAEADDRWALAVELRDAARAAILQHSGEGDATGSAGD
jgi:1-acyl-sn-glycerol-3-phosphate acyltransferase